MIVHEVVQGSDEWHVLRRNFLPASELAAAAGVSKYMTRSELLRQRKTGIAAQPDAYKQSLFDVGHAAEASARAIAEGIIGTDLFPVVCTEDVDGLPLLASLDGLTLDESTTWEHKLWSLDLADQIEGVNTVGAQLDAHYVFQIAQQQLVTGARRTLFMASDGTRDRCAWCWFESTPEQRQAVVDCWRQFIADLETYEPAPAAEVVTATLQDQLPAPSVRVDGALAIVSNLDVFGVALREYIERIPEAPSTDQEFADVEAACKALKKAEQMLDAAEAAALAGIAPIEEMQRLKATLSELARTERLKKEKLVVRRKDEIRLEIKTSAEQAYRAHCAALQHRIGDLVRLQLPPVDFAAPMRNKRTLDSLRDAVNTALANAKIEANRIADDIQLKLRSFAELGGTEHAGLFRDLQQLIQQPAEAFAIVVRGRIDEAKAAEERRLAAERERIRQEEERKAREQAQREADAERERIRAEEATKAKLDAPAAAPAPQQPVTQQELISTPAAAIPRAAFGGSPTTDANRVVTAPTPRPAAPPPTADDLIRVVSAHYSVDLATAQRWLHACFGPNRTAA